MPKTSALSEPNTLFSLEILFGMSYSSEREKEEMMDPRYVKEELKVIHVPLESIIEAVSAVELLVPLFAM